MITPKELMLFPQFEAVGLFVGAHAANGDWPASFEFNCLGFNIRVNVENEAVLNPPSPDTMFHIVGSVKMSSRNGAVFLVPSSKRLISDLSAAPSEVVAAGLLIRAAGRVVKRQSSTVNRVTHLKATIAFGGGQKEFKALSPESFLMVPPEGEYGRFVFGIQSAGEKTATGQTVVLQFLTLLESKMEEYQKPVLSPARPSAAESSVSKPVSSAGASTRT